MNKEDIIQEIAQEGKTKKEAAEYLKAVLACISKALKKGEDVRLIGFGTFKVVKRKARKGRNPQTGKEISIKAKKVVRFVPGKSLSESVK